MPKPKGFGHPRTVDFRKILKTVTVSRTPYGRYHASVLVDDGNDLPEASTDGKAVGIDVGITDIAVTSDGEKFSNPRWIAKHEKNRIRKERKLARKQKSSSSGSQSSQSHR